MRLGAFGIILFFISLNISLYMLNEAQVVGDFVQPPYEDPDDITGFFVFTDATGTKLLTLGLELGAGVIFGLITGSLIAGGTVALVLAAITMFIPTARWVIFGFPVFLAQMQVPSFIVITVEVMMAVVWFWFILGFIGQRQLEKY